MYPTAVLHKNDCPFLTHALLNESFAQVKTSEPTNTAAIIAAHRDSVKANYYHIMPRRKAKNGKSTEGSKMMAADPTESQNPRMSKVGRGHWRSSSPTPLLKQRLLKLVAQDHVS